MGRRRGPFRCRIKRCPNAGRSYETKAALGSHKRRVHGIVAVSTKIKRPDGGEHPCPYACGVKPYVTRGGLGLHVHHRHGRLSTTTDAVKKREYRAERRGIPRATQLVSPLPIIPGIEPTRLPRKPLTPGQRRLLARRILWLIIVELPRPLGGVHPLDIRDATREILATNFAVIGRRPSAAGDAETTPLRQEHR